MAFISPWIEKDALESLQRDDRTETLLQGARVARISLLGAGWTAAGVNLTFGRTLSEHPSMTITDGQHEILAYLITETAQSSALISRPLVTNGSRIRIEGAEFVPEPVGGVPVSKDLTPGVTFAMAIHGTVQMEQAPPIINLNYSKKFSQAVGQWMLRKMDDNSDTEVDDNSEEATAATRKRSRSVEEDENGSVASDESNHHDVQLGDGRSKKRRGRPIMRSWEEKLEYLKAYEKEFGHCNAPTQYKRGSFGLGTWVNQLRATKDTMSKERKHALNSMGFVWDLAEHNWNKNLERLKSYKAQYGNTAVPISYKDADGSCLGCWVYNQRQSFKNEKIKPSRKKKLDKIGFEFSLSRGRSSRS